MSHRYTTTELEAFLDEQLPVETMAAIEVALRQDSELQKELTAINGRRDAGVHSLGEIWRRQRLSCPTREQLGSQLLGVLDEGQADYIRFHLEVVRCRVCQANYDDLQSQAATSDAGAVDRRRSKYFQSSAGYLKK
jgi:hypothetical protein